MIYDVVIIGAGPAGSFLAYRLGKMGLRVGIVDKLEKTKRKVCGEYLCPKGVALLESYKLSDRVLKGFLPLNGMLIVSPNGMEVDTRFPKPDMFHGVSVQRDQFDQNLLDLAAESGCDMLLGVEVKKISASADYWAIETNKNTLLTRMLVGADGRNSLVSKTFNNDVNTNQRRVALHVLVKTKFTNKRQGEMHIMKDGAYVGLNPTGENEINYSLVLNANQLRSLGGPLGALNHYLAQSKNLSSRFDTFTEHDVISSTYPIQHKTKKIIPRSQVALIGDAAGFVDPLTGEGMYNALLSADILASNIIQDLQKNLRANNEALLLYEKQYKRILQHKTMLNRGFQWLLRKPQLLEWIAKYLRAKQKRADSFIGIIGNIYSPIQGLAKIIF